MGEGREEGEGRRRKEGGQGEGKGEEKERGGEGRREGKERGRIGECEEGRGWIRKEKDRNEKRRQRREKRVSLNLCSVVLPFAYWGERF